MSTINKTAKSLEMSMKRKSAIWPLLGSASVLGGITASCMDYSDPESYGESESNGEQVATVSQALTSGTYRIRSVHSNLCVDVAGISLDNGANVHQWACGTTANQRWQITDLGGNQHKIIAEHSGKALDAKAGCDVRAYQDINFGGASGCFTGAYEYASLPHNGVQDNWTTGIGVPGGYQVLMYEHSNFGGQRVYKSGDDGWLGDGPDYFNDKMSSIKVLANVEQYTYWGGANQKWYIDAVGSGQYVIKPVSAPNQCLDVAGWSTGNGGNIITWECTGGANQKFYIEAPTAGGGSGSQWTDAWASGGIPTQNFDSIDWGVFETGNGTFSENACRFVSSQVGTWGGYLYLKAEAGFVAGGWSSHENATVGDRWCKSGELRTKAKFGPYGKISARMRSPDRVGSNPGGKVGFIHALFTFRTKKVEKWEEIDVELTGLKPQLLDTNLITTNWNSGCTSYSCTQNSQSSVWVRDGYWSTGQWHDYMVDWRSQSISWYVDGQHVRTLNKSQFGGDWPDEATELLMNFWLPQHSIETSFGGRWTDADIEPTDNFEGQYDWFRFERCTSGC